MALRARAVARGLDVQVINLHRHRDGVLPGVHHPRSPVELLQCVRSLKPDVVHLHAGGLLSRRLIGLLTMLPIVSGAPVHFTFHSGGFPTSPEGRALSRWGAAAFALRQLRRIVGVNTELASYFRQLGVPVERIVVLRPDSPIEVDANAVPEALVAFARRSSPFLLSVGGMEPEYQVAQQVAAMESIVSRWPKAGLLIAGSGSELLARQQAAAASPYAAQVLLPGDVPHAAVLALMQQADVVLRPTLYDGDAISVREALQLGRPVVATRTSFRPDGVVLIETADSASLIAGIERALNSSADGAHAVTWDGIDSVIDGYHLP